MSLKVYVKDESFDPIYKEMSKEFFARSRLVPSLLMFTGVAVFLSQVMLPLVIFKTQNETGRLLGDATILGRTTGFRSFEFKELKSTPASITQEIVPEPSITLVSTPTLTPTLTPSATPTISPAKNPKVTPSVSPKVMPTVTPSPINVAGITDTRPDISYEQSNYDPRKDVKPETKNDVNAPKYFYLSIPKLNIKDAEVETNATHLNPDEALGHYPNTSLPGKQGNMFIFGHSVLPWFFNPKNYKTIFSTLDNLKAGDKIYVKYNNNEYTYAVTTKETLKPSEVYPLEDKNPKYMNNSTLTLMTCWPAGTKMKRLLVNASVVDY